MPKIILEIDNCKDCPYLIQKRIYSADSYELAHDWLCDKANNQKIEGYVSWNEEKGVKIPTWCPIKSKDEN